MRTNKHVIANRYISEPFLVSVFLIHPVEHERTNIMIHKTDVARQIVVALEAYPFWFRSEVKRL